MDNEEIKEQETETSESEVITDSSSDTPIETPKRIRRRIIIGVLIFVVCVIVGLIAVATLRYTGFINPYEKDYVDVTGRTAGDIAKEKNYKYEKFLKEYGLPDDMPKSTSERAVFYNIPVRVFVKKTPGIESFEQLKSQMGWDDTITENTTMGDALDKTKLKYYVGEEQLERFKTLYGLDSEITGETLYIEVRNIVDTKEKEFHAQRKNSETVKDGVEKNMITE